MSRWFRHYAGMMRDEKLVRVAVKAKQPVERVIWVWGAILESAAEINDGGQFEFDAAEAAYFLRTDEADLCGIVSALEALGRICSNRVVKWGDRQFQSDAAAERQKRYRERRKEARDDLRGVTRDVTRDVTPPSRYVAVTAQETETEEDTETEEEKEKDLGADAPPDFAFVGRIIRLKADNFREWRERYHHIRDLRAELALADDYYSENPPKGGKWFFPVSRWLQKAHEAAKPRDWRQEPEYRGVQ